MRLNSARTVMLNAALDYARQGRRVLPLRARGKVPLTPNGVLDATTDEDTIRRWWTEWPDANIGCATDGLVAIDVDKGRGGFETLAELVKQHGDLPPTLKVQTGGGGVHLIYRLNGRPLLSGSNKLGRGIDIKTGPGAYLVVPPSVHPDTAKRYEIVDELAPSHLPAWLPDLVAGRVASDSAPRTHLAGAERSSLVHLLLHPPAEGARNEWLARVAGHYAKAFKYPDAYQVHVEQANARLAEPLPPGEVAKTMASIWTAEHREASARPFESVDLAALADGGIDPPELVCGGLLYRGSTHSLAGPPDAGKSMLVYTWMLDELRSGRAVLLFDEESGREQVVEKLLGLGAAASDLSALHYVEFPGRAWDAADIAALHELLEATRPSIVGFDSSAAFLATAGMDEDRAPDVTRFWTEVLRPAARDFDAAVVIIDHVIKSGEGGRYARGSGAKLAAADVGMVLSIVRPFSRSQAGLLKLTVTKDRRGYLHRNFEVVAHVADESLSFEFRKTLGTSEAEGLSPAARKLFGVLAEAGGKPLALGELIDRVAAKHGHGLKRPTVSKELNGLLRRGLVAHEEPLPGFEKRWFAVGGEGPE